MHVTLTITQGPKKGRVYVLDGRSSLLVGRSRKADLQVSRKDPFTSRAHFLLELLGHSCRLLDMNSLNGTYVNGKRAQLVDLHDGDLIRSGRTIWKLGMQPSLPSRTH